MAKSKLTLDCWHYDQTRGLMDVSVHANDNDLNCLNLHVEEPSFHMLRHREFDLAEMPLSSFTASLFIVDKPAHFSALAPQARPVTRTFAIRQFIYRGIDEIFHSNGWVI